MASERQRLVELALESLQNKKRQIDQEIETLTNELRGRGGKRKAATAVRPVMAKTRKRPRYTREERLRRSQRMKAYWEDRRKQQKIQK